jgi:glycosyltransferase involved in cell wall biosynthesis
MKRVWFFLITIIIPLNIRWSEINCQLLRRSKLASRFIVRGDNYRIVKIGDARFKGKIPNLELIDSLLSNYEGEGRAYEFIEESKSCADVAREKAPIIFKQSFDWMHEVAQILKERGFGEERKFKVTVIFATHNEEVRLQPQSEDNPHGEDALRVKISQLKELFDPYKEVIEWQLVVVDNNSTDATPEVIKEIIREKEGNKEIGKGQVKLIEIRDVNVGKKGGTIKYGLKQLFETEDDPGDVFIYTDADIAVDLRQIGLLLYPVIIDKTVVVGTRNPKEGGAAFPALSAEDKLIGSVSKKLKKFLVAPLSIVGDTQCGFKAFPKEIIEKIVIQSRDTGFAFDTEWLMISLKEGYKITAAPILWVDSEAESHVNIKVRWEMIKEWIDQYERRMEEGEWERGWLKEDEPTLNKEQLEFLRYYADKAISIMDEEDRREQLERWSRLSVLFDKMIEDEKIAGKWLSIIKYIEEQGGPEEITLKQIEGETRIEEDELRELMGDLIFAKLIPEYMEVVKIGDNGLPVLDSDDRPLLSGSLKVKKAIHGKVKDSQRYGIGEWHVCVHVLVVDEQGNMLAQRVDKKGNPYDIAASGHWRVGESLEEGALRELREEIKGLPEDISIGEFKYVSMKIGGSAISPQDPIFPILDQHQDIYETEGGKIKIIKDYYDKESGLLFGPSSTGCNKELNYLFIVKVDELGKDAEGVYAIIGGKKYYLTQGEDVSALEVKSIEEWGEEYNRCEDKDKNYRSTFRQYIDLLWDEVKKVL